MAEDEFVAADQVEGFGVGGDERGGALDVGGDGGLNEFGREVVLWSGCGTC